MMQRDSLNIKVCTVLCPHEYDTVTGILHDADSRSSAKQVRSKSRFIPLRGNHGV